MTKLITILSGLQVIPTVASPVAAVTNNQKQETDALFEVAFQTVQKFFKEKNKNHKKYVLIDDRNETDILYVFEKSYVIINEKTEKIIELSQLYFDRLSLNYDFKYIRGKGLEFKNFIKPNQYMMKSKYDPYEQSEYESRKSLDFLSNVSNLIPNAWWWASKRNDDDTGYFSLNQRRGFQKVNSGICEYIAMANLLLYHQLFTNPTVFSSYEQDKYLQNRCVDILGECVEFPNHKPMLKRDGYVVNYDYESLPYNLYKYTKWLDLKSEWGYKETIDSFLKNKQAANDFRHDWEVAKYYWKGRENIDNGIPYILSSAKTVHAFVVYGYHIDKHSDLLLVNWLWGDGQSMKLISHDDVAGGFFALLKFWYGLKPTRTRPLEKVFNYNGNWYDGNEITRILRRKINY